MVWTVRRAAGILLLAVPVAVIAALGGARAAGYSAHLILTGSMAPAAPAGSVVLMRPLPAEAVRVGQIVLIPRRDRRRPSPPLMHRVVAIRRDAGRIVAETKGDANATPDFDPYVIEGYTMTPVVVIPRLGYVLATSTTRGGRVVLALVVVLLAGGFLVGALVKIWRPEAPETADGDSRVGLAP